MKPLQSLLWWPKSIRSGLQISSAIAIAAGYGLLWSVYGTSSADILHERHADAIERAAREAEKLNLNGDLTTAQKQQAEQVLEEISSNHHLYWIHPEGNHAGTIYPPRRIKIRPFNTPGLIARAELIAEQSASTQHHGISPERRLAIHSKEFRDNDQYFHVVQTEINLNGKEWDLYLLQDFTLERAQQDQINRLILASLLIALTAGLLWNEYGIRRSLKPLKELGQDVLAISENILKSSPLPSVGRAPELQSLIQSFNDLQERLKASIQKQTQLVAAMSHELLTPISLIQGHLSRLGRRSPSPNPETATALTTISGQTSRLYRLVHLLLDLSREGTGPSAIRLEPIALIELAQQLGAIVEKEAAGVIRMPNEICDPSICIQADRQRLWHVFEELVDHACLHGNADASNPSSFACESAGKAMRIRLRMPNYPMSAEHLAYSRDHYLRQSGQGMVDGGGLSIVLIQTLLQSMGSELNFEDNNQQGVDVVFDLALKD